MHPSDKLRQMAEVQRVLEALGDPPDAWTRENVKGIWTYDARLARKLFGEFPGVALFIISYHSFRDRGLLAAHWRKTTLVGYYTKTRNGYAARRRYRRYYWIKNGIVRETPFVYVQLEERP